MVGSPYGGTAISLPGKVEAENYDLGGLNVGYFDTTTNNSGNIYRTAEDVDLVAHSSASGGYRVTNVQGTEWLRYTVIVTQAGNYDVLFRVSNASGNTARAFRLEDENGAQLGTSTVAAMATTDINTYRTVYLENIPLAEGVQTLRVGITGAASAANFDLDSITFRLSTPDLTTNQNGGLSGTIIGTADYYDGVAANKRGAAFDGDLATYYSAQNSDSSRWVGLDLGSGNSNYVKQVKIAPRNDSTGASRLVGGRIQATNDATWASANVVTLYTYNTNTVFPGNQLTTVNVYAPTVYRYWRYIGGNGSFANLAELEFHGDATPPTLASPEAPINPWARGNGSTSVGLAFNDMSGYESSYILEASPDADFGSGVVTNTVGANTQYASVFGLQPNTTYYVRAKAINAAGSSAYTTPIRTWTGQPRASGTNLFNAAIASFEVPQLLNSSNAAPGGNGAYSTTGWNAQYNSYSWAQIGIDTGSTSSPAPDGNKFARLNDSGWFEMKADARATVIGGHQYELSWNMRKTQDNFPSYRNGAVIDLNFYDAAGTRVGRITERYNQLSGTYGWETFVTRGQAPRTAVTAGVKVTLNNTWPDPDNQDINFDNFRLVDIGYARDTVADRVVPRIITPGQTSKLKIDYVATNESRELAVRLMDGTTVVGSEVRVAAPYGKDSLWINYPVPTDIAEKSTYAWDIRIVNTGEAWNRSVGRKLVTGVTNDMTQTGSGTIAASNPNIVFGGRWNFSDPANPWHTFGGAYVRTRFSGTSITLRVDGKVATSWRAIVDGNELSPIKFSFAVGAKSYQISGLTDTVHTVQFTRDGEVDTDRVTFKGFTLDAGRGLLKPEPSLRKIETYGDSITSGGNAGEPTVANPNPDNEGHYSGSIYNSWVARSARDVGADWSNVSKGGTAIVGGWSNLPGGLSWWDSMDYRVWGGTNADPNRIVWDFANNQVDAVVIAFGQNDQFRNPDFNGSLRTLVNNLRAVYGPTKPIFITNTTMTGGDGQWRSGALPIVRTDPYTFFNFNQGRGTGGHPTYPYHIAMAFGDPIAGQYSLADKLDEVLVKPDAPAPVTAVALPYDRDAGPQVRVDFASDVSGFFDASDVVLTNTTTGSVIPSGDLVITYSDSGDDVATIRYTGAATLPDGSYTLTILGAGVNDVGGNAMAGDVISTFRVLGGDANDDGAVNFADLLVVAQNFNTASGAVFSSGDFNYDGTVNFDDLLILAQAYGNTTSTLNAAPAKAPTATSPKRSRTTVVTDVLS